ncbi:MAG: VOC family protein [Candidatus Dormibacteria bacterium]|jgi:predicted enzyme related to lactoylglutathione lyase
MSRTVKQLNYPVSDLEGAKELFRRLLGVDPYADAPYYVGFRVGDQEIGLDPNGHKLGLTGPVGFWVVDDVKRTISELEEVGATAHGEPRDVGGGMLIAYVKDRDGNFIGLKQEP